MRISGNVSFLPHYANANHDRVSYDDEETLTMKKNFANQLCLGGTMVWALDLHDPKTSKSLLATELDALRAIGDDVDSNPLFAQQKLAASQSANEMGLISFWTDCQLKPKRPPGLPKSLKGMARSVDVVVVAEVSTDTNQVLRRRA